MADKAIDETHLSPDMRRKKNNLQYIFGKIYVIKVIDTVHEAEAIGWIPTNKEVTH